MPQSSSPPASLAVLLARQADMRGEAIAVDDGVAQLSYAELIARARMLVATLAPFEAPIGILAPLGCDYIVAIVAAILAGKTYVPMDDSFPEKRNLRIVGHSGMAAIAVADDASPLLQALDSSVHRIDIAGAANATPRPEPGVTPAPDRITTIFYTSGSTGEPKGVCHSESGLLYDVQHFNDAYGIGPDDVHSLLFSPSVSISNRDIFGTLLAGARLAIVDLKTWGVAGALQQITRQGVTVFHSVPSAFRALFGSGEAATASAIANIRLVRLNGDRVLKRDVELYRGVFPQSCRLCLDLACTETRPYAAWLVDHDTPLPRPLVPVGYLRPDLHVTLLDDEDVPVADGEVGEIVVTSRGLSAGYWRDEALTREKFVASVRRPGMTEYRTGDFGRLLPGGLLEFVGRRDRQIKVRGNTVHLGEIEAAIGACPGVGEVAVIGRIEGDETKVIAYCTGERGEGQDGRIRVWCREHLAPALRPAEVILTDGLPMLAPGKVDLIEVGRLDAERAQSAPANQPDRIDAGPEDAVRAAWRERLGAAALERDLTFEEAGGDSLQAMLMMLALDRRLGQSLPNGLIDWTTRPSELAARIADLAATSMAEPQHADKPTIFLFPGIYGADFASAAFARRLGAEFPVVLMDYRDGGGELYGPVDREQVFREFERRLEAEGPPARLWLLGFSFGSRIAAEAARRLLARGVAVEFVGLIDGLSESAIAVRTERNAVGRVLRTPLARRIADSDGVFGFATARVATSIAHRLVTRGDFERARAFVDLLSRHRLKAAALQVGRVVLARTRVKAFRGVLAAPLPMPATLFVSTAPYSESRLNPDLGWSDWCEKLDVIELEGDHNDIIAEPRAGHIVAALCEAETDLRRRRAA